MVSNIADFYNNRGNFYALIRDYPNAINDFKKAIEIDADNPSAHFNIAQTFELSDERTKAIVHYKKVMEVKPRSASFLQCRKKAKARLNGYWNSYEEWM